jgi:hypothetical protein
MTEKQNTRNQKIKEGIIRLIFITAVSAILYFALYFVTNNFDIGIASFFITLGLFAIVDTVVDEIVRRPKSKDRALAVLKGYEETSTRIAYEIAKPQEYQPYPPQAYQADVFKGSEDHTGDYAAIIVVVLLIIGFIFLWIFAMGMWGIDEYVLQLARTHLQI